MYIFLGIYLVVNFDGLKWSVFRSYIRALANKALPERKAKALRVGEGLRPRDEKLRKRKYSK